MIIKVLYNFCLGERLWDHWHQQLHRNPPASVSDVGQNSRRKNLLWGHQFLNTIPQHNSARPCWEAGGWQRRKGPLWGDVLNKQQRDAAQTPCTDSNLRYTEEVYTLGHQCLFSAGYDSLKKQWWNKKRAKWLIRLEHLYFVSSNINAHLLSSVSVFTTGYTGKRLFHTQ